MIGQRNEETQTTRIFNYLTFEIVLFSLECSFIGIGTFKIFSVRYDIDISLKIQYHNNLTILPASQGPSFVKLSTVDLRN